jgi:hypothetical protein
VGEAVGRRGDPGGLLVRDAQGGLGQVRHPDAQRARAAARPRDRGGAHVPQRARVLHARQLLHPGRSSRGAPLLRGRGVLLGRHRRRGRGGEGARGVDRRGSGADGSVAGRHPALRPAARQPALPARAGQRDRGRALPPRLHESRAHERARAAPLAAPRAAKGAPRVLRLQDGLGAPQLVRARGGRAGGGVLLRPPELVPVLRGRASGGPRGGRRLRPETSFAKLRLEGRTRRRSCSGSAPTTWRCRPAGWSTPRCSTSAAASRAT